MNPSAITEPSGVDALAADGTMVRIRPAEASDAEALRALHVEAPAQDRYMRFFTGSTTAAERYAESLTEPDPSGRRVALVAERGGQILGVGTYEPLTADEGEIAFLVAAGSHGKGIGTLLLEHLAALARERGITRFRAEVLRANAPMLAVFADSGFAETATGDSSCTTIVLDTALDAHTLARITERERAAATRSLDHVLSPRTVAVVGPGRTGGVGREILKNLLEGGFTGRIYVVNPNADSVCGLPSYAGIEQVPEPVDLAVIAVPARAVPEVVEACGRAGVAGAVITSSGLADAGPHGREVQRAVRMTARHYGMRLIGPNCLGVANTAPEIRLNATFGPPLPPAGGLSLASQSGAVGVAVLDAAARCGIGVAQFVSLGNKADVSGNDLLLHWWRDPRTEVIGLYLESFGNPRRFSRLARAIALEKPVLVVKGGRSAVGRRAGASHTAAAATPEAVLDALFASSGVIALDSVPELLDVARLLHDHRLPAGGRLGIVGNAGGAGILAADAAPAGVTVPQLSDRTAEMLAELVPGAATSNPVDLGADPGATSLGAAVRLMARSGEVDAILAVVAGNRANDPAGMLAAVAAAAAEHRDVPVLAVALGLGDLPPLVVHKEVRVPVFPFPEPAVRAFGHVARYAAWRRRPGGGVPELQRTDPDAARALLAPFLAAHPHGGWVPAHLASAVLTRMGIPVCAGLEVSDGVDAVEAADLFGWPVVLKTTAPALIHKSDSGGVALDLRNPAEVRRAYESVRAATGDPQVLVQPLHRGVEMLVGLVRDPLFGPVVTAGTGGVLTDLMADRACRGLPLTDTDAREMVEGLRGAALLAGYRGKPAADTEALLDVLHRVALLGERLPEIAELDLNPVVVDGHGATVVDVRMRVVPCGPEPDPYRRRLA